MKYLAAALAAACLLGGAQAGLAKSADIVVQPTGTAENKRENIKLRLPANVNAGDPTEVIALRGKAMRAIEQACNPGERLNADISPDWQCRREMAASLELALRQRAYGG